MSQENEILLCYVSSATSLWESDELQELLEKSRCNNKARGITGALLYREGTFLQFLEGPKTEVETLFEKISQDRRHRSVLCLLRKQISNRVFQDWSMGYQKLGIDEAREVEATMRNEGDSTAIVQQLIDNFKRVNR